MRKKIIGLLTFFLILIFNNAYPAGLGIQAQGGLLGSGGNLGGMLNPLETAGLMAPGMAPSLLSNGAVSIDALGIGILPQTNVLMNPISSLYISGGMNTIPFNLGIGPVGGQILTNGLYDVSPLGLGMSQLGVPVIGSSMFGILPGTETLIGLGMGPIMGFGAGIGIGFGPGPMINLGAGSMIGFPPGPTMGLLPGPMMGFMSGPMISPGFAPMAMMGFGPPTIMSGPMVGMGNHALAPWDSTIPSNPFGPMSYELSTPLNNTMTNPTPNNPQPNPGREQSGNRRIILIGTSVEGTRPNGTPNIVKHYLDTYTGKKISGYSQGVELSAPDYHWWYGCGPTSAGMIMGYYDIYGYNGSAYDLILGGVAELSSFYPGTSYPIDPPFDPPTLNNPSLLCNKAIASVGHLADFWLSNGATGDPLASGRTIPSQFDCLADFMGTSQDNLTSTGDGNPDGQTFFYFWSDGARMTNFDLFNLGYDVYNRSGTYGIIEYVKYCGYGGFDFNQYILGFQGNTLGFSFSDYVNEIDAGRPVLLHMTGHMMLGTGYYLSTETVILHDNWSNSNLLGPLTMPWGGTYQSPDGITFTHYAVTCFVPL